MKINNENKSLRKVMAGFCTAAIVLGLSTGSVLAVEVSDEDYKLLQAYKKQQADKKLPPHQASPPSKSPANAKPGNLAEAATIRSLLWFSFSCRILINGKTTIRMATPMYLPFRR